MRYWSWLELKDKVEADLDLEGEDFIEPDELLGYANEAIDEVERQVHTIYEDYFYTRAPITLVSGQEEYDLPSDIYAMKIRGVVYRNGTTVFPLRRLRDWRKDEEYEFLKSGTSFTNQYGWHILNTTPGSPKIVFSPTPQESGAFIRMSYIRNANRLTDDDSILDIPEAANYVMQYIKMRCYEKEGHQNLGAAIQQLQIEKEETVATLSSMIVDNNNEIEVDTRLYDEMS